MKNRFLTLLLVLLLLLATMGISVGAISQPTSLTIHYGNQDGAFANSQVRIYQVGTMDTGYHTTLTSQFSHYPLNFRKDMANSYALSQTLSGYIALDKIAPYRTVSTDADGLLSVDQLPWGIYLIEVDDCMVSGTRYTAQPVLLPLPYGDDTEGYDYDVDILQKITKTPPPPPKETPDFTSVEVLKLWDDKGYETLRPAFIEVTLLKDGEVYDTAKIGQNTNWKHTWKGLELDAKWQVVEAKVPEPYTVTVTTENGTFVITNAIPDTPEERIDIPEDEIPRDGPPDIEIPELDIPLGKLPHTGLLQWPIPIMASLGIFFLLLGVLLLRRQGKDTDETEES